MEQLSFDDLEVWKPVVGYEGTYEVSSHGNVRVLARRDARGWRRKAARLKPWERSKGHYLCVTLCAEATESKRYVHELVMESFDRLRPAPHYQVRHLDGDHLNNHLGNLAWGTPAENAQDKIRHGRSRPEPIPACKNGHEFTPENTAVKVRGDRGDRTERRCRTCHNAEQIARRRKRKEAAEAA